MCVCVCRGVWGCVCVGAYVYGNVATQPKVRSNEISSTDLISHVYLILSLKIQYAFSWIASVS